MEQPCQPKESPVPPNYFTQIYILFLIGFHMGPTKIHGWFCIGLPKIHRQFRNCQQGTVQAFKEGQYGNL